MRYVKGKNGVEVPELRRPAIAGLADRAWKNERIQLLATLDESGADPDVRLQTLRQHDLQRGTFGPLLVSTFQFSGCDEIIRTACENASPKADFSQFIGDMGQKEVSRVACELIGVDSESRDAREDPKGGE